MQHLKLTFNLIKRTIVSTSPKNSPVRHSLNVAFGKYLLFTNTSSSGVLMLMGDIAQQEIEYHQGKLPQRYDYGRLGRMFLVGLALGPIHHYFYKYLTKIYPRRNFNSIVAKILLDQLVMSPACIAVFFYSMGLLEMKTIKKCNDEIKEKFVEVYVVDWCVWPPIQFLNFYFIPDKYQVFYINFATMLYNVFLSYIKHREIASEYSKKLTLNQSIR